MAVATVMPMSAARILGLALLGCTLALASAARAESPAECQLMFQNADIDDDGILSGTEIAASDDIDDGLASAFGDQNAVTLPEFMAACSD